MDNNLVTEEFLKEHGWIERPLDSYTEEDIEGGFVDDCLYITSPHAKVCGEWCYQHRAVGCRDNTLGDYWDIRFSGSCLIPSSDIITVAVKVRTIADYNRVVDFCKSIDSNFPI